MFICVNSLIFSVANLQTKYEKNLFYIQVMINKKQKEIIRRFAGKIDETKPAALNNLGVFYYTKEMYIDAIDAFKKAIALGKKYFLAYANLGIAIKKLLEMEVLSDDSEFREESDEKHNYTYDDVIDILNTALKFNSNSDTTYNNLGEVFYHIGRFTDAIDAFKKAIELKPDNPDAHYNLGFVYGDIGRFDDAQIEYNRTLKIDENYTKKELKLEIDKNAAQMYDEDVERAGKEVFKIDPVAARSLNSVGLAQMHLKRYDDAIREFEKAMQADPAFVEPLINLSRVYLAKKDIKHVIQYLNKAIVIDKDNPVLYNNLGIFFNLMEKYDIARGHLEHAIELKSDYYEAMLNLSKVYMNERNLVKAKEVLKKLYKLNKNDKAVLANLGYILYLEGDIAEGVAYISKAIEKDKEYDEALFLYGKILLNDKKIDDAIKFFEKVEGINPKKKELYFVLGQAYRRKGNFEKTLEYFQKAIRMNPKDTRIFVELALVYKLKGEYEKALNLLDKVIELDKRNPDFLINKANILIGIEKYDQAIENFEGAMELSPEDERIYINLGALYQLRDDLDSSLEMYLKAIQLNTQNPNVHFNLGSVYAQKGWWNEAIWEYRTVLELNPNFNEANFYLAQIYFNESLYSKAVDEWEKYISNSKDKSKIKLARKGIEESLELLR